MGHYSLADTKSGKKTLLYRNGREIRLHSAYDPEKEAERSVQAFNKGRATIIAVYGLGLGYHVQLLKKRFPETTVIIVEHDREVVDIACAQDPSLSHYATFLPGRSLETLFESTDMSGFRGAVHYFHTPSYQLYREYYDRFMADMGMYITSKISDLLTRHEFESLWTENIFLNLPILSRAVPVNALFGKFKGYPGIIVSAGPSLRKNLDMLQSVRDRALIVCVDTAAKVLAKMNIPPHIIMTLDAQKHSIRHFLGLTDSTPALAADLVCSPKVIRDYCGDIIASTTSKFFTDHDGSTRRETTPVMDWVEEYIPQIGDIQSGGSVATSAFDLLLNLGCDPIILVGQDLAYTGREIHCSGTHHNDDWIPMTSRILTIDTINQRIIRKRKIKMVPAYGGKGQVISDFVFDLYRGWFEDSAGKVPVAVINATEGGGRIAHTQEEPLGSLSERLPKVKPLPEVILRGVLSGKRGISLSRLKSAMEKIQLKIREVRIKTESIKDNNIIEIEEVVKTLEQHDLKSIYAPVLRKINLYLARKKVEPEKGLPILIGEIKTASQKLDRFLENSLRLMNRP